MSSALAAQDPGRTLSWGIIGLGDVTQTKSGPPFYKCRGSQLVAVMRRTPGKAAAWAAQVASGTTTTGYEDLEQFLQHPGLEAVYIATRPGSHLELCRQVAKAGKAAYVEKPVGRCAAETSLMVEVCQQHSVPLYTAYISRAYRRTQTVRRLLEEGAVGDRVTSVEYTLTGTGGARGLDAGTLPWRLDAEQAGGGLVMDVGCHVLDRIDWLCGPLVDVDGFAEHRSASTAYGVEDYVSLRAKIGPSDWSAVECEGASVACSWDFSGTTTSEERDELVLKGPKGSLKMAAMSPSLPVQVLDSQGKVLEEIEFETPEHTAEEMIQAVTDDLLGVESKPFLSRGDNALRTATVLDTVLSSFYGDRDVGFWSKQDSWPRNR